MKIISKFKDYYDYQAELYGVDNLHVWERNIVPANQQWQLSDAIKYLFSDEKQFLDKNKSKYGHYVKVLDKEQVVYGQYYEICVVIGFNKIYIGTERYLENDKVIRHTDYKIVKGDSNMKRLSTEPIYLMYKNNLCSYWDYEKLVNKPYTNILLSDFNIQKYIDAETAYLWIEEYIGYMSSHPEMLEISNKDKIIEAGFDLKTSFRNIK